MRDYLAPHHRDNPEHGLPLRCAARRDRPLRRRHPRFLHRGNAIHRRRDRDALVSTRPIRRPHQGAGAVHDPRRHPATRTRRLRPATLRRHTRIRHPQCANPFGKRAVSVIGGSGAYQTSSGPGEWWSTPPQPAPGFDSRQDGFCAVAAGPQHLDADSWKHLAWLNIAGPYSLIAVSVRAEIGDVSLCLAHSPHNDSAPRHLRAKHAPNLDPEVSEAIYRIWRARWQVAWLAWRHKGSGRPSTMLFMTSVEVSFCTPGSVASFSS